MIAWQIGKKTTVGCRKDVSNQYAFTVKLDLKISDTKEYSSDFYSKCAGFQRSLSKRFCCPSEKLVDFDSNLYLKPPLDTSAHLQGLRIAWFRGDLLTLNSATAKLIDMRRSLLPPPPPVKCLFCPAPSSLAWSLWKTSLFTYWEKGYTDLCASICRRFFT